MEFKDEKFETMLLAYGGNEGSQENTWYLDTTASNHMCEKKMFIDFGSMAHVHVPNEKSKT